MMEEYSSISTSDCSNPPALQSTVMEELCNMKGVNTFAVTCNRNEGAFVFGQLRIHGAESQHQKSKGLSTGAIVGIVVGSVLGFLLLVFIIVTFCMGGGDDQQAAGGEEWEKTDGAGGEAAPAEEPKAAGGWW